MSKKGAKKSRLENDSNTSKDQTGVVPEMVKTQLKGQTEKKIKKRKQKGNRR